MASPARVERQLFPTLDEMIAPNALSQMLGRAVRDVRREPFHSVDGLSGGKMSRVLVDDGAGQRYVLKRISYADDWVMRVTDDHDCRAVLSWTTGLLDRLPPDIAHETIACARDGDGWAILLHDVGPALIPPGDDRVSLADNERLMDGMAALNAAFWEQPDVGGANQAFVSLRQRYRIFSEEKIRPELGGADAIPPIVAAGWDLVPELLERDVADLLLGLRANPDPLADALGRYPQTFIHGDWKMGNLGIHAEPDRRVILLDWAAYGLGTPGVEIAWYLAVNCARLPVSKEATIESYRQSLARRLGSRFDDEWWRPQLDLGLLGGFLLLVWPKTYNAAQADDPAQRAREREEIAWWSARTREATKWL
jgi:hypothetical protein